MVKVGALAVAYVLSLLEEEWVAEGLYADLLIWNEWWWQHRREYFGKQPGKSHL